MVDVSMSTIGPQVIPLVKLFAVLFIGFIVVVGGGYFFLVVMLRKRWQVRIYEPKSDGNLHLDKLDVLEQKKNLKGTKTLYWLKRSRCETIPPPYECVERHKGKDYCDYLKLRQSYIPIMKNTVTDIHNSSNSPKKRKIITSFLKALKALKSPKYQGNQKKLEDRFVYIPVNRVPHLKIGYHQIDYDIDMMRINSLDNLEEKFKDKMNWIERYGPILVIGLLIGLLIVVTYLSFEYMRDVISQNLGQTNAVVDAVNNLADKIGNSGGGGGEPPVQ